MTRALHPIPIGFTLLELMLALLLLGLLTSVALPGYRNHWLKAHRAEAVEALNTLHLAQEAFRTQQTRYAQSLTELMASELSAQQRYRLRVLQASAEGYTLEAEALGDQVQDQHCQRFRLVQQQGQVSVYGLGAGQTLSPSCWPQ
ncbi:type IV pilin protein [Roseateles sp. SL47]|uniref:type IV pilin protein n=1 Tax=Roseateles sp. SL47 TaxID=2995138 RepID=UPI00226E73EA|nr:type IV pilin protein [Roseateles sp. SL47]WAC71833.1 type IV pilin protein [Roseateles sp. SL47]